MCFNVVDGGLLDWLYRRPFDATKNNKFQGSNSHAKHTAEEAARRKSKNKKVRNKKRKMLKFRRRRNK